MRLLRMMAVVAVAALVAVGPASAALASTSPVISEDKIHVENLTAVVSKTGSTAIDGLVVCDFVSTDYAEVTATLTQGRIYDYSNGDFVQCGGPLDVSPLGGNHVTNYLYFKPGRALLHLTFGLCDTTGTVCGSYSYDGYIMIRKA